MDLRRLGTERDGGPDRRAGREHLRGLRLRGPWRRSPVTRRPAPVEQPWKSNVHRVRAARSRDRLRLGEHVRRFRRIRGGPDEHALPADARRRAGLGRAGSDLQRPFHAAPGPARDRPGRGLVSHRPEQPAGLVARSVQSGLRLGGVDVHPLAGERDVAARGRPGRVGLPLEEPRLPRRREPSRRRTVDVLRPVDHRLSGRDAERRARRRRRPAELRRAGQGPRLERGQRGARLRGRAPDRRQRLPGRLHGTPVHAGQHDRLRRNCDVLSP